VLALLAAVFGCALILPVPDFPSTQSSWSEGSPDTWAGIDLSSIQSRGLNFICPMDRDVSSTSPGSCPRCGMKLVAGIPEEKEYLVEIATEPQKLEPGKRTRLVFHVEDPKMHAMVRDFEIVHEKLYHFFVVSQDLKFFKHIHPEIQSDGTFHLVVVFPNGGMYRVLSDFYPKNGSPQLVAGTLLVPGGDFDQPVVLAADEAPRQSENSDMELETEPRQPVAGSKTTISLRIKPNDGVELYLGAWAHMLAASSDLVDMIHSHPLRATDHGHEFKQLDFDVTFPHSGMFRIWIQTQRKGVVNTVAFNVPVSN